MKNLFTLLLCVVLFIQSAFSQCAEQNENKVLLVGDSWAFFMGVDQTINTILRKWGFSNYRYVTNTIVSENGAKTDDFLKQDKQDEIAKLLNENPSIKVVHLSIGGNDVLGNWKVSFTQAQTDTLKKKVERQLQEVVDFIKSVRPDIRVFWSGYVYTNFNEVIETSPLGSNHPFHSTWQKMEFPSMLQINNLLNEFSDEMEQYAATDPRVDFVKCTGLMQYTFGQNTPLGIAPGGTYPAFTQPLPYGDPQYPSPANSMRDYLLTKDCFHLSPKGYLDFIDYHTQKFYHKFLMDDFYAIAESNNQSGSVATDNTTTTDMLLGEFMGKISSTVLTFNTTGMKDTSIAKASIFLRMGGLSGNSPLDNIRIRVKSGFFGNSIELEPSDLTSTADASGVPCRFGSVAVGSWMRFDLPAQLLPHIQSGTTTQFVLSAPGFLNGRIAFTNAEDSEFAPVLNVVYGETPLSTRDVSSTKSFKIFPNPADNFISIQAEDFDFEEAMIFDVTGKKMKQLTNSNNTIIDVSDLPQGLYILTISSKTGISSQRFIKQ